MRSTRKPIYGMPDGSLVVGPVIRTVWGDYLNPSADETHGFTLPYGLRRSHIERLDLTLTRWTGASGDLQARNWHWATGSFDDTTVNIRTYNYNGGSGAYFEHDVAIYLGRALMWGSYRMASDLAQEVA
jgi:hypothetical protein